MSTNLGTNENSKLVCVGEPSCLWCRWRTRGRGKLAQCSGDEDDYTHEESSVTVLDTERGKVQEEYKVGQSHSVRGIKCQNQKCTIHAFAAEN